MPRPRPTSWFLLPAAALALAACNNAIGGDGDVDAANPPWDSDGGIDAPVPCVPTGDEVFGDGRDNDCDGIVDELKVCGDGSEPFTTIAEAVAAAPDGGGVEVCAGVYHEHLVISDKSIRLNGAGAGSTILDAGGDVGFDLVGGHELVISGFTIRNGHSQLEGGAIRCTVSRLKLLASAVVDNEAQLGGGGIYAIGCLVGIEGSTFERNEGHDRGGAILLVNGSGSITASRFSDNSSDYGGGVALVEGSVAIHSSMFVGNRSRIRGGGLYQMSDGIVEDSIFNANYSGWTGGAVHVNEHAPIFRRTHFTNNEAAWEGGGFYLHKTAAVLEDNLIDGNRSFDDGAGLRIFESPTRLERNMISNNVSIDGDGGGFKCSHVKATYIDNMIMNNQALGAGGGAELDNDSSVFRGGVVSGNRSSIGGGIHVMLWPWSGGLIEDVAITGNRAHRGGGIYIENNYQPVTIRRIHVEGNEAFQAAGVYTRGTMLRLSNSVIINNEASDVGGGFFAHPSSQYPWTKECPCPPIDPPGEVTFTSFHGNVADAGAGAWFGAPNISFRNNILAGHANSTVMVHIPPPAPPPPPPTDPTMPPPPPPPPPASNVPGWRYNDTHPATFENMSDPTGSDGNFASDPDFMDPAAGDFRLDAGSACIDAAEPGMLDHDGSRADLGAYGGPDAP